MSNEANMSQEPGTGRSAVFADGASTHPEEARAAVPLEPVAYCWPIDLTETLPNDGWCVVHANDADMSDAVPLYTSATVLHRTFGHVRTLRLSGRDDGLVEDIERAAIFLSANQPISDDTLEMLYGCVAWCLDRRHDEDSEVYRNRARAILSAANQPKSR